MKIINNLKGIRTQRKIAQKQPVFLYLRNTGCSFDKLCFSVQTSCPCL
ncbi:Hypothetical protein EUBREC_3473 [Agathobacter rectalis ATCC 33656]|uniref:Uncharacterized protein n=1 Tax=Agathobacter rectalis (strain ATCC 33656 / DSM 3377 / JCM 17463 / KCTC 5835 / VPI 0990) TaxID=515619 RepID=C4ZFC7_AGARV|nr:Hypothetical protein EUBREC_3473 [Agathobacter rectalis ATCC 33656]